MQNIVRASLGLLGASLFAAASFASELQIQHADAAWNGTDVPKNGICTRRGGEGFSPAMTVNGIPDGASKLELRFTDEDWNAEGAHGVVQVDLPGDVDMIEIPSFLGETDDLPDGFTAIASHKCSKCGEGVYLGPCSGGKGHAYVVNVYAIGEGDEIIGNGQLKLGDY